MKRWSSAQLLRTTEFVYAVATLFALTQGPVYRVWSASAEEIYRLPNPSIPHVYFASFVAIQLPALAMFFRRCSSVWACMKANIFLFALITWLALTVIWSTFARYSLPEVVALALTTTFGLYLVVSFTIRRVLYILATAMALGVGWSWVAVMRLWDGAVNFQEDHWSGIYFNRNSLAPVASIAIVAALGLVSTETLRKETGSLKRVTVVLAMLALGVVSGIELWRSESRTSPLALAMAVVATTIWLLIRFVFRRVSTLRRLEAFSATTSLTVLAASFYLVFAGIGDVPGIAERVPSLIPRQALWSLSWAGILEKPWLGWGWMAAWHTTEFFNSEASEWSSAWDSDWAHNGYHDVLLGGGLVAAVLLLAFIWAGTQALARRPVQESALRLFLTVFCLSAATQESFFVGSHFVWALLVFALSPLTAATTSVEQKEPGEAAPRTT